MKFPLSVGNLTNTKRLTSLQGAFGYKRSYYYHTGVDLYVRAYSAAPVYAVESGYLVAIEDFTGPPDHPHWLYTQAALVEGPSGVVCYGEIKPNGHWIAGLSLPREVLAGDLIGYVRPVIPEGNERPDIFGHSRWMLHFELYTHGTRETVSWHHGDPRPANLLDPTELLTEAWLRARCEYNFTLLKSTKT